MASSHHYYDRLLPRTPDRTPSVAGYWPAALLGVACAACLGYALLPASSAAPLGTALLSSANTRPLPTVVEPLAVPVIPQPRTAPSWGIPQATPVTSPVQGGVARAAWAAVGEAHTAPTFDLAWAASCLVGVVFAFWAGRRVGDLVAAEPIAMWAASGESENRSEWDKRVSMLDENAAGQAALPSNISETEFSRLAIAIMQQRYGPDKTERIVQSWKLTEAGDVYRKRFGSHPLLEQVASSYVEGLTAKPVWAAPAEAYPWAKTVQEGWETIRAELEEVLQMGDEEVKRRGSLSWLSIPGDAGAYGVGWKTLGLCNRGYWDEDTTRLFKNTCRILRKSRAPIMEAFFAKMPAHTEIKAHSDYTNFVLTFHLGLKVPEGKCWFNVGDAKHEWKNGGAGLFDTTFLHEAANVSDEDRYVLILRVWHPDLTSTEIEAITFLFDCLDDSDILTLPDGQMMYDMMKAHRLMEWNAILGPGDSDEESQAILNKMMEAQGKELKDVADFSSMVKDKLVDEGGPK